MDSEEREALEMTADELLDRFEHGRRAWAWRMLPPRLWLDSLATWWLGRRHGYPVRAGRSWFYETDESRAAIDRAYREGHHGIYIAGSAKDFVFRGNTFTDNRAG